MQLDWLFHRDDTHELWVTEESYVGEKVVPRQGYRHLSRAHDIEHVAHQIGLHRSDISHLRLSHTSTVDPVQTVLEVFTYNGSRQAFLVRHVRMDWEGATKMEVGMAIPLDPAPF